MLHRSGSHDLPLSNILCLLSGCLWLKNVVDSQLKIGPVIKASRSETQITEAEAPAEVRSEEVFVFMMREVALVEPMAIDREHVGQRQPHLVAELPNTSNAGILAVICESKADALRWLVLSLAAELHVDGRLCDILGEKFEDVGLGQRICVAATPRHDELTGTEHISRESQQGQKPDRMHEGRWYP